MWDVAESEAVSNGCSWPMISNCDVVSPISDDVLEWTQQMAVEILWAASGRQFGVCSTVIRPCADRCAPLSLGVYTSRLAYDVNYLWSGLMRCGSCGSNCSCSSIEELTLWHRNVREITEVTVDGVALATTAYRLQGNRLLRIDGETWPTCQDWNVAIDEVGAWSVEYTHGRPVPTGGQVAAGLLACELAKAVVGADCELPRRVQNVTRQGVSIAFVDPMQFLDTGRTGLYEVDLWLASVNPRGIQREARIFRPDSVVR